ncbi:MAG: carbohydrate-binding family 6 protein, partial [Planctomycetota bacterium]|nr:carbohydrate-binding family 6 protein [Planctomycetota bacterium]
MKSTLFNRFCLSLTLAGLTVSAGAAAVNISFDTQSGPLRFAASEIQAASAAAKTAATLSVSLRVDAATLSPQGYRIQRDAGRVTVTGGDAVGAMYGGLDVAEAIRTGALDSLKDTVHSPHIAQRGIKFNIPLDVRTPTYSGWPDSARLNALEMWSMDFWRETFDDMARHRYNLISYWSLNPFPSIVKVPEFPHVALEDVQTTDAKTGEHIVVKKMTMDEKIQFWRDVMQLAKDRGVDVYFFNWNVFLEPAAGKDGITMNRTAPRSIEYFRASVRETIKTYPLLAGLGITAGEGMPLGDFKNISKEEWLWQTYGEGIRDGLKDTPERKFRLIHRFHMTGLGEIQTAFKELPCPLDLSFKYAIAHMYSVPNPSMI